MTTAELLKKREEEKNNPQISATPPSISAPKPAEGMNMAEARMAGNSDMPSEPVKQPGTPLYDAGVSFGQIAKEAAVKNPITTPEYENFRNEVIGAKQFGVETPEQAEARERRDFIKQGLTGFTEGLSALANLYYTTKWAPNQKQVSQMPVLQQQLYRERLERDKKLENFRAWQRAKADKAEEREYNLNLFNFKQEAAQKAAEKKAKLDAQAAEIKYLRDLGLIDARKAADLEKQKGKAALDKELEGIKQKNRISIASINNKAAMDRVNARGSGGANATIRVPIGNDGEYAEYRKNDFTNPVVISQIYNSLPDDYRVKGKNKEWNEETKSMEYPFDENPSTQKMQEAIGKALSDGYLTEMAPEIQVGGVKKKPSNGSKQEKTEIVDWKPSSNVEQKQDIVDWSPTNKGSDPITGNYIKDALDKRKKRKEDILQAGKDSLGKKNDALKSDTFR